MKLLFAYLKKQRAVLTVCALLVLLLLLVFALYGAPREAVGYALLLSAVVGLAALAPGFLDYGRRHRALASALREIQTVLDGLPEPWDLVETDYQALLRALQREKTAALNRRDRQLRDMTDYYTLWVHQIKTPISAMGLILQEEDTPRSRELSAQLFCVEQYVEMVLAYLRLDSDATDLVLRPCLVEGAVRQSVRKFAPMFIRSRVRLELRPMELRVLTDEKWLCFALEQLLSNAVKYTPQGTVTVYCQDRTLYVQDTGMGIAPEDLPRVCEKGFTGCNGRQDKKASGVGLYLTNRVLTMLGCKLTLTSRLGEGTTAAITFGSEGRTFE